MSVSRNLGSSSRYSQSVFISFLICIAVIPVSHLILIFQSYFLQQFWPETVLIVSLQLTCQGHTLFLSFHVVFHKELMETQAPKNTWERTFRMSNKGVLGDMLVAGDKHTGLSTQELWILIQMNHKWKKMKPHKENYCRSKRDGWPALARCPGCKWQEELQGSVRVYWQSCEGKLGRLHSSAKLLPVSI